MQQERFHGNFKGDGCFCELDLEVQNYIGNNWHHIHQKWGTNSVFLSSYTL